MILRNSRRRMRVCTKGARLPICCISSTALSYRLMIFVMRATGTRSNYLRLAAELVEAIAKLRIVQRRRIAADRESAAPDSSPAVRPKPPAQWDFPESSAVGKLVAGIAARCKAEVP